MAKISLTQQEMRENYIKELFKKYHTFVTWGSGRCAGFYVDLRRRNLYDEIKEWIQNKGYHFYSGRNEWDKYNKEQKIYLSNSSEGLSISFETSRFETFEELKIVAVQLKEHLHQYLLETVFFDESFLYQNRGENMDKVRSLYEEAKWTESFIEERNKRKVFRQLDNLGKFESGTYDRSNIRRPYGLFTYDVNVINKNEIVVKKLTMKRKDEWNRDKIFALEFETENIEVFDGVFASVFHSPTSEEIYSFFKQNNPYFSFDFIKTKNNETRLQGLYLKNQSNESTYLSISTDTTLGKKEEIQPYIQLGVTNKIGNF